MTFVYQNFCAGPRRFFIFLSCECQTASQTLDFNFQWKHRVYDPSQLSYAYAFWVDLCTISCFTFPSVYTVCKYQIYLSSFCHGSYQTRSQNFRSSALNTAVLPKWETANIDFNVSQIKELITDTGNLDQVFLATPLGLFPNFPGPLPVTSCVKTYENLPYR